ncbi:MAG TPA: hypothetical protein DC054_24775 [Blastocatellia bacterium]|nr:hypothetical protein [Blastocatellia bacterium]
MIGKTRFLICAYPCSQLAWSKSAQYNAKAFLGCSNRNNEKHFYLEPGLAQSPRLKLFLGEAGRIALPAPGVFWF